MNGIGIDVSKRQLDVGTTDGETLQVSNNLTGFSELDVWLREHPAALIVLEATGGYEQPVLDFLHKAGHPVVRANALRARRLAQGMGHIAKTDRLDAYALAQMAALVKLPPYQPLELWQQKMREFVRARRQAMEMLTIARQQQEMVGDRELRRLLQANINRQQALVERLGKQITEQVAQQPQLAVLKSMKGVGPALQAVLASYLPELGRISGKRIASLVGVAPMSHDSGTMRGKRSIQGGRAEIRQVLYMAAMSAMRHEPRLRDFYQSLRARGKEGKVAIVAVMRKMLVILNARVRDAESGPIPARESGHPQRLPASGRHYRARLLGGPEPLQQHSCSRDGFTASPAQPTRPAKLPNPTGPFATNPAHPPRGAAPLAENPCNRLQANGFLP